MELRIGARHMVGSNFFRDENDIIWESGKAIIGGIKIIGDIVRKPEYNSLVEFLPNNPMRYDVVIKGRKNMANYLLNIEQNPYER